MGRVAGACHTCGDFIPASEFEKCRAATVLRKQYCGDCVEGFTTRRRVRPTRDRSTVILSVAVSVVALALVAAVLLARISQG